MLGFKSFEAAQSTHAGIELIHMLKKGQMAGNEGHQPRPAEQVSSLAA
jgi:transposase-like protein